MTSYITMDEQRTIRSEVEHAMRITQQILWRLDPLERSDERISRTEQALAALERLLWTTTSGQGRGGPAVKARARRCHVARANIVRVDSLLGGRLSGGGAGYARAGAPVISFQIRNRLLRSFRYSAAASKWRRGRKCDAMMPCTSTKHWACRADLNRRIRLSRSRVG